MSSRLLITRRRVLQQLATTLGAAAVSLPAYSAHRAASAVMDPDLSVVIDELILNRTSAAIIGEAYLTQYAQERSEDILSGKIQESLRTKTREINQQALLDQIRVDFERGDIVKLHGWILSNTEARLCALCTF